jgi:hypothetical protein
MLRHLHKDPAKDQGFVRRLAKWRQGQAKIMPHVAARVLEDEDEDLTTISFYFPSDLSDDERKRNRLNTLFKREISLREAVLCDLIQTIRCAVICIDLSRLGKQDNARSQDANTRANNAIRELEAHRDKQMTVYNAMRQKLVDLAPELGGEVFPIANSTTTYRKSTTTARQVGDSHRKDGEIWRADIGAGPSGKSRPRRAVQREQNENVPPSGTFALLSVLDPWCLFNPPDKRRRTDAGDTKSTKSLFWCGGVHTHICQKKTVTCGTIRPVST